MTVSLAFLATAYVSRAATYDLSCSGVVIEQISLPTATLDLDPPALRKVYRLAISGFTPSALTSTQIRIFGTVSTAYPDGSSTELPFPRMVVGEAGVTVRAIAPTETNRPYTILNNHVWAISVPNESVLENLSRTKSKTSIFVNPSPAAWPGVQGSSSLPSTLLCLVQ